MTALCGLAQVKNYDIEVGDFSSLNVLDNINVTYESDASRAGTAVFDCQQNIADGLIFNNNMHGKLTIQVSTEVLDTPNLPTLHVYSKSLSHAENAGDSLLTLRKVKADKELKVVLSDNGRIDVTNVTTRQLELQLLTGKGIVMASGRCDKLVAKVLGKGTIDALEVKAREIRAHMTGTGTIDVDATGVDLQVRGSGTGRINYLGAPTNLKVRKIGPLKINQLDP